jgi:hypothetical protein
MLGIFLIYYLGKQFYLLAEQFKKPKWGFAILGIVSFYAGVILAGLGLGIASEFGLIAAIDTIPDLAIELMAIPFGLLSCWALYSFLKSNWSKIKVLHSEDVLDADLM